MIAASISDSTLGCMKMGVALHLSNSEGETANKHQIRSSQEKHEFTSQPNDRSIDQLPGEHKEIIHASSRPNWIAIRSDHLILRSDFKNTIRSLHDDAAGCLANCT